MGRFTVKRLINGQFQFNLKAENGIVILTSEGYKTKAGCLDGIDLVRQYAQEEKLYYRRRSGNLKHYFNLISADGEIIGTSELYESTSGRDLDIESVKRNAPKAVVADLV